jgi:hypothetical protein
LKIIFLFAYLLFISNLTIFIWFSLYSDSSYYNTVLGFKTSTSEQSFNQSNILESTSPVVKISKMIEFSFNSLDIIDSEDINLKSFTISVWFNSKGDFQGNNFLINKGGIGNDTSGYNLNYGLFLTEEGKVNGGYESLTGDDNSVTSQKSYTDGVWHNAVLTFDDKQNRLKLYMDGLEVATQSTNIGIIPDTTGKQPIRLGANSFEEGGNINGHYTGTLDDINIWDLAFSKEQVLDLYNKESQIQR